jgi:SnoaL-like protein
MPDGRDAVIHRVRDAWNRSDAEELRAQMTSDVELHNRLSRLRGQPYLGHPGVAEWTGDVHDAFESFQVEVSEIRHSGDRSIALGPARWSGKGSGIEYTEELGWIVDFEGDLICRLEITSPAEALSIGEKSTG